MPEFNEVMPKESENQKAFILDHGKIEDGQLKYADDFKSYGWNIRRNNKLKEGAFVLNRRPGKLTKDRRFEIYGGGYVESISDPDKNGNVIAEITHPFGIEPPIRQGDSFIENFKWKTKNKKPNTWEHFWNQYGMNEISYQEFLNLVEDQHCVPIEAKYEPINVDLTEEEIKELKDNTSKKFTITFDNDGPKTNINKRKSSFIARKIDFDRINAAKRNLGALGEELVFDILKQQAEENGLQTPIHVSKEEGDGLGYDIRAFDEQGNEIKVEVKASKKKFSDGFEMTKNEVEASLEYPEHYKIYYVYDIDIETKDCKIKIYEGPFTDESYRMVPTSYRIYQQ